MKLLVTGSGGQLGNGWQRSLKDHSSIDYVALNREALDICDEASIAKALDSHKPDVCVNTAAYTQVDKAETQTEEAYRGNVLGPKLLAEACAVRGIQLVHYSTDYVFSGKLTDREIFEDGYPEDAPTNPVNNYGATKLEGEQAVLKALPSALVLRVSWLCGLDGTNFVKAIINRAKTLGELKVVNDQFGVPSFVPDVVEQSLFLIQYKQSGLFHLGSGGCTSWYNFAKKIVEYAQLDVPVEAVGSSAFPTVAKRPHFSKLATKRLNDLGMPIYSWEIGCKTLVSALNDE
jgi:dTDP-4-dehydrorhamnose reductase